MRSSLRRIKAMLFRYLYLHRRSMSRTLELVFWPVMELLVWGFLATYIHRFAEGEIVKTIYYLVGALIFWDLLYRSQQGVSISFIEDIWTQNILNLFISPLRIWEWLTATFLYGFLKIIVITVILSIIGYFLYSFSLLDAMGFYLIPFIIHLLFFGWSLGIFTSGLLIRWGHSVEALIWGIPFLIQPLSAIYYPLEILPQWMQAIAKCLPSTYVFEGMRSVMAGGDSYSENFIKVTLLNILFFALASLFFARMYHQSQKTGKLGRLGMD